MAVELKALDQRNEARAAPYRQARAKPSSIRKPLAEDKRKATKDVIQHLADDNIQDALAG